MPRTVVGILPDRATAEALRADLVRAGIAEAAIEIRGPDAAAAASHPVTTAAPAGHGETTIEHFFRSVFGFEEDVGRYSEATRRGRNVVVVYADDVAATDRARDVMMQRVPEQDVQIHER